MTETSAEKRVVAWPVVRLGDVARTASGGTPKRGETQFYGGDVPWIKSGELGDRIVYEAQEHITRLGVESSSAKVFPRGTLCIALYGATVGKLGILGIDAATNQAVCGIFLPDTLNIRYVFRFLQWKRQDLVELAKGGAQPNISQEIVRNLCLPMPPLEIQQDIVAEIETQLSRLDAAVTALKRAQANLKRYRASVLKAACGGGLVSTEAELANVDGRSYVSAEKFLSEMLSHRRQTWQGRGKYKEARASLNHAVPGGWVAATLDQVTAKIGDVDHKMPRPAKSEICYVSTKDFRGTNDIDFSGAKRISETDFEELSRKIQPENGDLLLSRYGTIGEVRLITEHRRFQASYSIAIIKSLGNSTLNKYLYFALQAEQSQAQFRRDARASAQPDLGLEFIRLLELGIPPPAEQKRIVDEIENRLSSVDEVHKTIEANLRRVVRLRQSILSKAFGV